MSQMRDVPLNLEDLAADPIAQFQRWFDEAGSAGIRLANAIALATAGSDGSPAVRHVLLRGFDERGFVFYTNQQSRKGRHLAENPRAAFTVFWRELDRQVSVTGDVVPITREESQAYFATRPREARIGAWASRQSEVIASRDELMRRFGEADEAYPGDEVPLPPYWGGYLIRPDSVEFWQGRAFRLHDRFRYTRTADGWSIDRLSP
jgi:pyridoxamine 5'-phosphate oxidase